MSKGSGSPPAKTAGVSTRVAGAVGTDEGAAMRVARRMAIALAAAAIAAAFFRLVAARPDVSAAGERAG